MSACLSIVEWMVNVPTPWEVSHVTVIRDTWPIKATFVLVGVTVKSLMVLLGKAILSLFSGQKYSCKVQCPSLLYVNCSTDILR